MDNEGLYQAMENIDPVYISAAHTSVTRKKSVWISRAVAAACLVFLMGVGLFQKGVFGPSIETVTLANGEKLSFEKTAAPGVSSAVDMDVTTRPLTNEELPDLFAELPITANAVLQNDDAKRLIGIEGDIGSVKVVVCAADVQLLDTVIDGADRSFEINDVEMTAGYFITEPNSKGQQDAIYYAAFELAGWNIYLENAGAKENSEALKTELGIVIQKLTENAAAGR